MPEAEEVVEAVRDIIETLRGLWEGCPHSMGYQHHSIVIELCRHAPTYTEPTVQWVLNHLHQNMVRRQEAEDEEIAIIEKGLEIWNGLGRPRTKELASGA